ncbi:putative tRNA ligase [Clavispora lusitaniae]|uniref:tRNA ligase kinase domain-containing protein n=2 Tax=Clavispora lusitaniae TaxID=36911 RepID=C4Y3V3_CLAL4|nr:uncharacterized protein CLUG_02325 [Clavispora lusitaniae ATCC 42720]KAF5211538.1 hypothetical protein E0198_002853 [Clavispora lusitaniae]EEQ38199.1 hypothetical protein CLUG_02325 [Clavispora lusitaniae ATCC 42720]KAF7580396.1 tRNA ligase kinase domain family protein [Clavispora lusitaniae]QFZ27963.1 putative tRNA ligase [Clavispora lusitaniae]QFZ32730.1 putative tRNA ligase [Clavispora lusitaniae]
MKYLLVPISTIGCGKSTVFRILKELYPTWAHVENDDCGSKKEFYNKISHSLENHQVVLLDRNNHLALHRKQIVELYKKPDVTLIALVLVRADSDRKHLWNTTFKRVEKRGDNHQSIAGSSQKGLAKAIMSKFLKDFCPFDPTSEADAAFDYYVDLELGDNSSMANAGHVIKFLHTLNPELVPLIPDPDTLRRLYEKSLGQEKSITPRQQKMRREKNRESHPASPKTLSKRRNRANETA